MSRKRDTNWTRDEITVLLDSIIEITRMRAEDKRRTNSREVFEYAAKKLGEKGHPSRAEREKCRTKWKKMKEEFTHARKARETGEGRIAPGIEPFYARMLEFINGNFHNISPHSTIVRRSSSISSYMNNVSNSSNSSNSNPATIRSNTNNQLTNNHGNHTLSASNNDGGGNTPLPQTSSSPPSASNTTNQITSNGGASKSTTSGSRASARLAANTNGLGTNDTGDVVASMTRQSNPASDQCPSSSAASTTHSPMDTNSPSVSHHQLRINNSSNGGINTNGVYPTGPTSTNSNKNPQLNHHNHIQHITSIHQQQQLHHEQSQQLIPNGDTCNLYNSVQTTKQHNSSATSNDNNNSLLNSSNDVTSHLQRDTDISYRVSTGCRQITIFGDHDVDIKFRGDCVTINKINADYASSGTGTGHGLDT